MPQTHRVGGDVDAYCTKCRMILGHTILAMVGQRIAKVRCNTCQGEHAYKAGPPGTPVVSARGAGRAASAAPRPARARIEARPLAQVIGERDTSTARPYSAKETYAEDDLVAHPSFGVGVIEAVRHDKIDVTFPSGTKTLVHGLAGGSRTPITFEKTRRVVEEEPASRGAADKPPAGKTGGLHAVNLEPPHELPRREPDPPAQARDAAGAEAPVADAPASVGATPGAVEPALPTGAAEPDAG